MKRNIAENIKNVFLYVVFPIWMLCGFIIYDRKQTEPPIQQEQPEQIHLIDTNEALIYYYDDTVMIGNHTHYFDLKSFQGWYIIDGYYTPGSYQWDSIVSERFVLYYKEYTYELPRCRVAYLMDEQGIINIK